MKRQWWLPIPIKQQTPFPNLFIDIEQHKINALWKYSLNSDGQEFHKNQQNNNSISYYLLT